MKKNDRVRLVRRLVGRGTFAAFIPPNTHGTIVKVTSYRVVIYAVQFDGWKNSVRCNDGDIAKLTALDQIVEVL